MSLSIPSDPRAEAQRVLEALWSDRGLPVDPAAIARLMGVEVKQAELPANVSAALLKKAGEDPVILLQASDHPNRKRFSCAHELGHYVRRAGEDVYEYVDLRGPLATLGIDEDERFANQFAANLLMPEDEVRKQAKRKRPLWLLAKHFEVSADAMKWRLKNLGLPCDE